jgi:hypothetical protein
MGVGGVGGNSGVISDPTDPFGRAFDKIDNPQPGLGSRGIIDTVLEATGNPGYQDRSARIERVLAMLAQMQDNNPESKTRGNFRWYWHEEKPGDLNAVEFVTQKAVLLKLRYADRLSPKALEDLDAILSKAVEGIHRQKVDVGYTNIFLMKAWNLIALGEALGRPDLAVEGAGMLDQWIDFTDRNGITEFLSPTYYGVDLDNLGLMANQLADQTIREKAVRSLRLFWSDIAANWFEPAQRLGGAHGRDYDYLTGHGELDRHLRQAGWITASDEKKKEVLRVFDEATSWNPPEDLHRKAITEVPRFVFRKCGPEETDWTSQQVGHEYSIGVSGTCKGPEDKPFALNLSGPAGPKTVMVNFFMDGRDDPYGNKKIPTGSSGHKKAHHLAPTFRAVQSGSDVLFLATHPGTRPVSKSEAAPVCLRSNMDLPAEAVVWSADHPLDPSLPVQSLPDNVCFLRMGKVTVGIRFLLALDTTGKPVSAELINDGQALQAKRLTVTHAAGSPGEGRGTVAVEVRAAEGLDDAGFADFRKKFTSEAGSVKTDGSLVKVETEGAVSKLVLETDLVTGKVLRTEGGQRSGTMIPWF